MTPRPTVAPSLPAPAATPIAVMLSGLGRAAARELTDALEPTGLKHRHVSAMNALREGPLTQTALGAATAADPVKLVGLLNELETEGLIVRKRDAADRRRHNVELSELGRARLAAVDTAVLQVDARLAAGLDPAQRAYLEALLAKISENLDTTPHCDDPPTANKSC